MTAAIGASIAVLTGIGAGLGIGHATAKAGSNRKTAGSRKQNQQSITSWLCTCRGNSYLWFRYRIVNFILIIIIKRKAV